MKYPTYREVDKNSVINNLAGKLSFTVEKLIENVESLIAAISRAKPASSKGQYVKSLYISSTMGPGLKIELSSLNLS